MKRAGDLEAQTTQPLSCFSFEPICEVLAQELEQALAREHAAATAEAAASRSAQAQPDAELVEPAGR